ncbi:hypothetical protein PENTCL1PPCAC_26733, partial [Pristionchus entomophagus]
CYCQLITHLFLSASGFLQLLSEYLHFICLTRFLLCFLLLLSHTVVDNLNIQLLHFIHLLLSRGFIRTGRSRLRRIGLPLLVCWSLVISTVSISHVLPIHLIVSSSIFLEERVVILSVRPQRYIS